MSSRLGTTGYFIIGKTPRRLIKDALLTMGFGCHGSVLLCIHATLLRIKFVTTFSKYVV